MRSLLASFVAALCAACATTVPTLSELRPAPAAREYAFRTPSRDAAELTLLRDRAFAGSAVAYNVLVNGKLAARIRAGEFISLYVPAGDDVIEVRHPSAHLGAIGDSTTIRADAGLRYYFRIDSDLGQIKLLRTTASSAEAH